MNEYFSPNGRIIIAPFKTDEEYNGSDRLIIKYYKIHGVYTYSVQAQIQKRVYCKWPHPQDEIFETVYECKRAAKKELKEFCDRNNLKKAFSRLVPRLTDQLDLFADL